MCSYQTVTAKHEDHIALLCTCLLFATSWQLQREFLQPGNPYTVNRIAVNLKLSISVYTFISTLYKGMQYKYKQSDH